MKRYYMVYESDERICGDYSHVWASASAFKTAKGYITRCKKVEAQYNPRNFKIYDLCQAEENGHAKCVYGE